MQLSRVSASHLLSFHHSSLRDKLIHLLEVTCSFSNSLSSEWWNGLITISQQSSLLCITMFLYQIITLRKKISSSTELNHTLHYQFIRFNSIVITSKSPWSKNDWLKSNQISFINHSIIHTIKYYQMTHIKWIIIQCNGYERRKILQFMIHSNRMIALQSVYNSIDHNSLSHIHFQFYCSYWDWNSPFQ